jgi:ADP-L-glycero-D-manno-heptose 6-epimerase
MIIVTGAAGFIGSNLVQTLNEKGYRDIVLVDDFSREEKNRNFKNKEFSALIDRSVFDGWLRSNQRFVQFVFHLGARTDTAEFNWEVFEKLNLGYSKKIWITCAEFGIPMIYASSAATYGDGKHGYSDNPELVTNLEPLNPYGISKNEFDKWVLLQEHKPSFWAGLKFFNVYGPNEYHKGRMASVVYHAFRQISETGEMKLFRSHRNDYRDGGQLRDFIYVKDVTDVMLFLMESRKHPGIYNLGTGKAETFLELVNQTFKAMNLEPKLGFIDTPEDIRDKYQYYTQAEMGKLRMAGYTRNFMPLAEGVPDYVTRYLMSNSYR